MAAPTTPYVTWGTVVNRSTDDVSPAENVTYDIEIHVGGQVLLFEGAIPAYRAVEFAGSEDEEADVYPFEIGQRVIVSVDPTSAQDQLQIHEREVDAKGPCEE